MRHLTSSFSALANIFRDAREEEDAEDEEDNDDDKDRDDEDEDKDGTAGLSANA